MRIADEHQVIAKMVMVDSEQRLSKTLSRLTSTLTNKDAHGTCIDPKISHDELFEMAGTMPARISMFRERFRKQGLLEANGEHSLVIKEKKLTGYLAKRERLGRSARCAMNVLKTVQY